MNSLRPSEWKNCRFSDVVNIEYGKSPKEIFHDQGKYPVIGTGGVTGSTNSYLHEGETTVIGRKGTINNPSFIASRFWPIDTTYYVSKHLNAEAKWFYYFVQNTDLTQFNEASGVPSLNRDTLYAIPCLLPPPQEQRKIAAILTAVDDVIESTQAQISKLKGLKTGMMQELFTKGIGHKQFKDSALGKIPTSWKIVDANEVCSKITKGTTPPKADYVDDNKIPFLRVNNLQFDNKIHFENDCYFFFSKEIQEGFLARSKVYSGDILMNIVGPPLGKIAIAPDDYSEYNINQAIIIYRTISEKIDNHFFLHFLTSDTAQNWLQKQSKKTSGQQNLTIEICKDLPLPVPPMGEQKTIANALDAIGAVLTERQKKYSALLNTKKALMQDLLTGKVRVNVN